MVMHPEIFGALGNGVHDDGPAIQEAINACCACGGGEVLLSGGKTYLSRFLILRSGVDICLEEGSVLQARAHHLFCPDRPPHEAGEEAEVLDTGKPSGIFLYALNCHGLHIHGEGSICGALASVVAGIVIWALKIFPAISLPVCMITALVSSSLGQIGDLAESMLKRMMGLKDFSNLAFDNYSQSAADMPVNFTFNMVSSDVPEKVTLKLTGLKPAEGSTLVQIATNTYLYTTEGASTASINLLTSTADGEYAVDISAKHYNDAHLDNLLNYINPRFTGSSARFGNGQEVPFAFSYVYGAVEKVTFTLNNLQPRASDISSGLFTSLGGNKWQFTPANSNEAQNVTFVTTSLWSEVGVTSMEGDSYSPAGPFSLSRSLTVASQSLRFTGDNHPDRDDVTVYTKSGVVVGTFYVARGGGVGNRYYYNNAAFDIDLTKFTENEEVYMSYTYNGTYYTPTTITLSQLAAASSSPTYTINMDWTTARPW